jgi:uroporphyrinogen-III synthase
MLRGGADAVLLFSPSAVHHLYDLLGRDRFLAFAQGTAFVAIGPVTESMLRQEGVSRIVLARDTTAAAALEALAEFFIKPNQGLSVGVNPE